MKEKHRILSKKNKKVKQLMRRFQDEEEDEETKKKQHQNVQKQNQTIKKVDASKKLQEQPKRKGSDRTNDSFDIQNQSEDDFVEINDNQDTPARVKTTMSSVFSKILTQEVKQESQSNPIFAQFNKPLKKVQQELRKDRENVIQKRIKTIKESRGHVLPQNNPDGPLYEKELKIQAAKGIIKILAAVKTYQESEGIE